MRCILLIILALSLPNTVTANAIDCQTAIASAEYKLALDKCQQDYAYAKNHPADLLKLNVAKKNLADLHYELGHYNKAEVLFKEILRDVSPSKNLAQRTLYIETLHAYATHLSELSEFSSSQPLFEQALQLAEEHLGTTHTTTGKTYNDFAGLYSNRQDYTQARKLYNKAWLIQQKINSGVNSAHAEVLNNLGTLELQEKNFTQAKAYIKTAIDLYKKTLGDKHPDTATAISNLAVVLAYEGNLNTALNMQTQACKIFSARLGKLHPSSKRCQKTRTDIATTLEHKLE